MKVIPKKNTSILIAGLTYEVDYIRNGEIRLIDIKPSYSLEDFTHIDGSEFEDIYNIQYSLNEELGYLELTRFNSKELKKGDILIPKFDKLKTLTKGVKYIIDDIIFTESGNIMWIKFEGLSRNYSFNHYDFYLLSVEETRKIKLDIITTGESALDQQDPNVRKLDLVEDKDYILMEFLMKSILNKKRKIDIIPWIIRIGSKYDINEEDYSDILSMSVSELIEKWNNRE